MWYISKQTQEQLRKSWSVKKLSKQWLIIQCLALSKDKTGVQFKLIQSVEVIHTMESSDTVFIKVKICVHVMWVCYKMVLVSASLVPFDNIQSITCTTMDTGFVYCCHHKQYMCSCVGVYVLVCARMRVCVCVRFVCVCVVTIFFLSVNLLKFMCIHFSKMYTLHFIVLFTIKIVNSSIYNTTLIHLLYTFPPGNTSLAHVSNRM